MATGSSLHYHLLPFFLFLLLLPLSSSAQQLSPSHSRTLVRLQRILEFPTALNGWDNHTNFCYLPQSTSFSISCSGNRITELTIVGNGTKYVVGPRNTLSANFSIDSLFTTLSRLPSLTVLSLVSLGLWGNLPPKVDRFPSLTVLNLSSNYIYGEIPKEISSLTSLKSLALSGNLFNGSVPAMSGLSVLEELDLSMNRLGPEFPVTGKNIVTLVLRNNSFRANLPLELRGLTKLQRLDVSSNRLSGPIPSFLFSLPTVRYLDLSGNSFRGALPADLSCSSALAFVDISRNQLVGNPPVCILSNTTSMSVLYSWNCLASVDSRYQHPSSDCIQEPLAVMPTDKPKTERKKNKLGLMLGIVGGIVGGAILVSLIVLVVFKKARMTEREHVTKPKQAKPVAVSVNGSVQISPRFHADTRHMSPEVRLGMLGIMPYREFDKEELEEATNNFDESNLVQQSAQVQLYRGRLQDGFAVTIRCFKLKQKHSPQVLLQYMESFAKLRHRHLVSIHGHCIEIGQENSNSTTIYLVFEHFSNGTLRSHLTEWRKREMLKWPQRVSAVIGVARGIQFLHTVTVPGIVGNDLHIENILLDETLTAKISNYNLLMPTKNKNNKVGQEISFSALEERDVGRMEHGDKEDVYQLGHILLEVITGKPAATESELEDRKHQLQKISMDAADLQGIIDPSIKGTFAYDSLRTAVELALNCLSKDWSKRPSIDDVLWNLQYSVQVQDGCASSEN